jgi:multicomponent Na+:H+ antiporter subunit E
VTSRRVLTLWSALAVIWLLLSGHYTPLLLGLGLASASGVAWLALRMGLVPRLDLLQVLPRIPGYALYLVIQMARASVDVIRRVLDPRLPISPTIVKIRTGQRTDPFRVLLANSITLTPGTISVELAGDRVGVHALTREGADALAGGDLDRRVGAVDRA